MVTKTRIDKALLTPAEHRIGRALPGHCECDWKWHNGAACGLPPLNHDDLVISPSLCTRCLFVCEGEREDEQDAADELDWRGL